MNIDSISNQGEPSQVCFIFIRDERMLVSSMNPLLLDQELKVRGLITIGNRTFFLMLKIVLKNQIKVAYTFGSIFVKFCLLSHKQNSEIDCSFSFYTFALLF